MARGRLSGRQIRLGADGAVGKAGHRTGGRRARGNWRRRGLAHRRRLVWDARTALRRAHAFADYRIEWLEEPLRQNDVDGYAWLRDRSPVPIAAGEGECGRDAFRPLIDQHALDVYQVDLSRCGFTDAAYIKNRVEEIGARLCNHCYTSPLTVAASLHWLATCRDAFLFEDCVEDLPLRHELTVEKMQAEWGRDHRSRRSRAGRDAGRGFREEVPGRGIGPVSEQRSNIARLTSRGMQPAGFDDAAEC